MNPSKRPPRGFTLIELLVVVGIIIVLIGIIAAGVRHTRLLANRHATTVRLKLCEDLLAEYKAVNGYKNILGPPDSVVTGYPIRLPTAWITGQFNSPMFVYPKDNGYTEVTAQVDNPVSALTLDNYRGSAFYHVLSDPEKHGNMNESQNPNDPRWVSDVVRWTQGVMFLLLKDPKNRSLVSNLPSDGILETMHAPINTSTGVTSGKVYASYTIDAAVVLDAWHNPIVFVPPGGMHVWMNPDGRGLRDWVVRTSGVYDSAGVVPPVGPNDHPFFASTGPDDCFSDDQKAADFASDNVYSFQSP
jgi:type II secretory pathway pseudopilin PulG